MNIAELGEFRLIERLTKDIALKNPSTLRGVGDDCAVVHHEGQTLVSTDLLLEGVHFDLHYTPLRHLGYKAAVVAISDILAMMGRPTQLLVGLGVSQRFDVESVEEIYSGLQLACQRYGVDLVGGDTTASLNGLTLSLTAIGEGHADALATRAGAKPTDLILLTGNVGAAYMGLQILEREKRVFLEQQKGDKGPHEAPFEPDFQGREYLLERQLKPEARLDIVKALREASLRPTAMIDVSDGLASDLMQLCHASHTGCRLYEDRLPLDYQTAAAAEELNLNVSTCALHGGEDYELLFTLPLACKEEVEQLDDIHLVGYMTDEADGQWFCTRDHQDIALRAQGWKKE